MHVPDRNQIKIGGRVWIETKQNQGTGKLTEGTVKEILTHAESHPHGIKVNLEDGQTGRVKRIDQAREPDPPPSSFVDLHKIGIPDKENMKNEFKETFAYDRKRAKYAPNKQAGNNKKYNGPQELAKEICAFGNSGGGFVFLGVGDDGNIVGLEEDRKMANCADYEDRFANHMRSKLESLLNDKAFFGSKIRYVAPTSILIGLPRPLLRPANARLFASVAPDVNTTSGALIPTACPTSLRASSTRPPAALPVSWLTLDGFPNRSLSIGTIISTT